MERRTEYSTTRLQNIPFAFFCIETRYISRLASSKCQHLQVHLLTTYKRRAGDFEESSLLSQELILGLLCEQRECYLLYYLNLLISRFV